MLWSWIKICRGWALEDLKDRANYTWDGGGEPDRDPQGAGFSKLEAGLRVDGRPALVRVVWGRPRIEDNHERVQINQSQGLESQSGITSLTKRAEGEA